MVVACDLGQRDLAASSHRQAWLAALRSGWPDSNPPS